MEEARLLDETKRKQALFLYLLLAGIFISLLVSCNLIFQKFIYWEPFGLYRFEISAGLIPYPLTFLLTDLITEIYGRKKANLVVVVGLVAAVLVMLVVMLADLGHAMDNSPVNDETFTTVFGLTGVAVGASMSAYLVAQLIDIRLFHFWKKLTKGRHLWIRNNFSTIFSQVVDTSIVLLLLCSFNALPWAIFWTLFASGFLFKVIVAALDTPIFYLTTYQIKRHFKLGANDELEF